MVHLPIHLAWEAKVGGPVNYRWMYSVERYMHKLKGYVRNKSRPEGSIAEGYIAEECLTFCSRYLHGIETKFNRPERNYDGDSLSRNTSSFQIFGMFGQPFGKANMQELSNDLLNAAIFYILQNCEDVQSFISEHKNILSEKGVRNIDNIHKCEFSSWFHKRIGDVYNENDEGTNINMLALARGLEQRVICYPGCNINGEGIKLHYLDVTSMIILGNVLVIEKIVMGLIILKMARKRKKHELEMIQIRNTKIIKRQNQVDDENVEINLDLFIAIISLELQNEIFNVRGKAKGVKSGEGIEVEIYNNRIITPKAISEIHVLFHQKINGPWTSYSEYPKSELDTLFARYLAVGFSHNQLEEEVKKAFENSVKCRYSDWMLRIRKPIFEKHETREDRYKHPSSFIPSNVWKEMVDKWMGDNWQHKSDKNKINRSQSQIIHTTGRVSMAKHRSDMVKETGSELGPIDWFKKFHTKRDGESWATEKAKDLWDQMDNIRSTATSEGSIVNEWEIYRNVTGEPSHGRVLGLGTGIQGKDVYGSSSSQTCSKRCKEIQKMKEKEWEDRFKQMESTIDKLQQQVPVMVQAVLQSLGLSNIQLATQGGGNDLRDVIANSQENVRDVHHGNVNEKDGNENSLEEDSEKDDDDNENEESCEDDDD
ncbi:uncharacterized protein LOC120281093 [Dioscorea cayenensis subsp. rotundata]|uniref:Uncharacterized protein LOC120281093 n=1 Tax=Dioscorea cayennensis subsp. rotundata TaxID=55577 RepID=A0AB40CYN2_DIOCR|nr:uncharacterized protein LOC120281093 [Dioscorea cayenensis subsp. rotundata]